MLPWRVPKQESVNAISKSLRRAAKLFTEEPSKALAHAVPKHKCKQGMTSKQLSTGGEDEAGSHGSRC